MWSLVSSNHGSLTGVKLNKSTVVRWSHFIHVTSGNSWLRKTKWLLQRIMALQMFPFNLETLFYVQEVQDNRCISCSVRSDVRALKTVHVVSCWTTHGRPLQHLSPKMCASPSKDFVWAKEGLREIDQVININNTELSSGPVPHCGPIIYQMFESLARCLWSFENVYIDGYAQFRIPVNFNRRLAVLYLPKPSCYPSGFTFCILGQTSDSLEHITQVYCRN